MPPASRRAGAWNLARQRRSIRSSQPQVPGGLRRHDPPALSLAFAAALPSLAGIPLTIGFIAKFHALASGVDGHHRVLLGTVVAGSIIGLYYDLRIIVTMAAAPGEAPGRNPAHTGRRRRQLGNAVLAALVLLLIGLGAYPTPLLTLIHATASMAAR